MKKFLFGSLSLIFSVLAIYNIGTPYVGWFILLAIAFIAYGGRKK